ncbi:MAG: hypothetical protein FWF52_08715 [Candidatus Azobacteroides sp.]|nr:hypothetical protein [Candidatus Azobacteroides sp.]
MNKLFSISLAFWLAFIFFACNDEFDHYSTNPNDRLAFSKDTVAFDTILSTVNTPFQTFMIYNTHAKPLLISSIYLENGEKSPFRINVDGRAGSSFSDVEIRGNDSIYVLVNAKPSENASSQPVSLSDRILFVTNGVRQEVILKAASQDAVMWKGETIFSDSILSNDKPFLIYDSLVISEGATVKIREGTTFYMHSNAEIIVRGTLQMEGTFENPIVVRGDRFDYLLDIPYDLIPGQWGGIRFESSSYGNEWNHVYIRNGKYGLDFGLSDASQSKIKMENVVMTNVKGVLIHALNCQIEAKNCEFSNAKDALLDLTGGQYQFTHCTIANAYVSSLETGWGNSNDETIVLSSNYFDETTGKNAAYPLTAFFYNTIIWGSRNLTTSKIRLETNEPDEISLLFQNCIIPNGKEDNNSADIVSSAIQCLFNVDPQFKEIRDDKRFYDFSLDSISPARNIADPEIAKQIPLDIHGINRFLDEGPDIGGYEYVSIPIDNS